MGKIIAVVGPTATGKTSLALDLCRKFNGEIISVDSRQAYRGMEIGTGKGIQISDVRCQKEVPIHLYDLIEPDQQLNAYDYAQAAWEKMEEIWGRGKVPFLVGGTGFYLDVILGGVSLAAGSVNHGLRGELESLSINQLVEKLKELDPAKLETVDTHNKYRLIRAVEIALGHPQGHPLPVYPERSRRARGGLIEEKMIVGLTAANQFLYQRADERLEKMLKLGLVNETHGLVEKYGWAAPGLKTLGYGEFQSYLAGQIGLVDTVQRIKFNTHAYIRRQKTYFKKHFARARWFDVSQIGFEKEVVKEVESFLV